MDRLFLDANVLFSAAYRGNPELLQFWKLKNATLCSSRYALEEARINLAEDAQRRRLILLENNLELFEAIPHKLSSGLALPEKDRPILLAAIAAKATHLITGDLRHFGPFFGKTLEGIFVTRPAAYLKMRRSA